MYTLSCPAEKKTEQISITLTSTHLALKDLHETMQKLLSTLGYSEPGLVKLLPSSGVVNPLLEQPSSLSLQTQRDLLNLREGVLFEMPDED